MIEDVVAAWWINQRINVALVGGVSGEGMLCTLSKRGGRNVARQFAHLHNVRAWQLKNRAKALFEGARVFATAEVPDRETLLEALDDSARRVEQWLRRAHAGEKGFRAMKRGLVPTLAYLVNHEAHHRGSIVLTCKTAGHPVDRKALDAILDWNKI